MKTSDFYYDLPPELIAQTPIEPRDSSRLLYLNRESGETEHRHFTDILHYLKKGDLLVINNSRVIPARLFGNRTDTNAAVELLLLTQKENNVWETLAKPGKRAKEGAVISFGDGRLLGKITAVQEDGNRIIEFDAKENIYALLDQIGQMPLPPYITKKLVDKERYQTVYSKDLGSAAAPTAGLHFTSSLLDKVRAMGVDIAEVTLHVGLGTFRPVKVEDVTTHKMHSEHFYIPQRAAEQINNTKQNGGRIICVGTTSCRTLESAAALCGESLRECSGDTEIFIYPGYSFRLMDGLITNFHLPESTLIMLVSAFCGYENTMKAYKQAVAERYRFFSFGDAMLIGDWSDKEKKE